MMKIFRFSLLSLALLALCSTSAPAQLLAGNWVPSATAGGRATALAQNTGADDYRNDGYRSQTINPFNPLAIFANSPGNGDGGFNAVTTFGTNSWGLDFDMFANANRAMATGFHRSR